MPSLTLIFTQHKNFISKLLVCFLLTPSFFLMGSTNNKLQAAEKKQIERSHYRLGRVVWNYSLAEDLTKKIRETTNTRGKLVFASQVRPFQDFIDGSFDVLLRGETVHGPLSPYEKKLITQEFGSPKKVRSYIIGHTVIYVIVHKRNPIHSLTLKQLEKIYRGSKVYKSQGPVTDWKQLGDGKKSGPIVWFMPPLGWYENYVMRMKGMTGKMYGPRFKDFSKKPYAQQIGVSAIVGNVMKDQNSIGFFTAPLDYEIDERVKLLAIAVNDKSEPILPTHESVYEGKYPLSDRMTLYLHPNAPSEAKEFCKFATGKEAVGVIKKHKLFSEYNRQKNFSEKRLLAAKKGKGTQVEAFGHKAGKLVLRGLVEDFVRGYEPMQLKYVPKAQHVAVGEFLNLKQDVSLLLLDRPLTDKTLDKHMAMWLRQQPDKFDLGQVGVGVIVHPLNKVDWLKHEELQNIFTGKINHWSNIERSGISTTGQLEPAIKKYALKVHSKEITSRPVIDLFKEVILNDGKKKMKRPKTFKTSQEIVNAISLDPTAIGFINLADINPKTSGVKLIGIVPIGKAFPETIKPYQENKPADPKEKQLQPTTKKRPTRFAQWEVSADYPLLKTWSLYVNRRTKKDIAYRFADFVEAKKKTTKWHHLKNPQDIFGGLEQVNITLRKHGLIRPTEEDLFKTVAKPKKGPKPVFSLD